MARRISAGHWHEIAHEIQAIVNCDCVAGDGSYVLGRGLRTGQQVPDPPNAVRDRPEQTHRSLK
jgi:hypothetical protein